MLARAQDAAFAIAKTRALRFARLSGRSLGRVMTIRQVTNQAPEPVPFSGGVGLAAGAPASSITIATGSQPVSVTVTVTWALR